MKLTILLLTSFFWLSCSKQQPIKLPEDIKNLENLRVYSDTELSYRIKLKREQTFGDTEDVIIGGIESVNVGPAGRVYITDAQELDIKVYEPDGHFLTRLGRKGQGPGEFTYLSNVQINKNRLFAFDVAQQGLVVFSLDYQSYDYTINLADNRNEFSELGRASLKSYNVMDNDTFLVKFSKSNFSSSLNDWDNVDNSGLYYLMDKDGEIISEKLFEMKSSINVLHTIRETRVGSPAAFFGKSLTALSSDNHVFMAWSEDFLIKEYNPNGEYLRAFYYPHEKVSLTQRTASDAGIPEFILENMQSMDLPETWPVLESMFFDDENRLWISTVVDNEEMYEWWVLKDTGELIAKLEWPRNEPIEEVKNGYLYTRETEEETGLVEIVRYRINMEEI